jgi:hypothetical protein
MLFSSICILIFSAIDYRRGNATAKRRGIGQNGFHANCYRLLPQPRMLQREA